MKKIISKINRNTKIVAIVLIVLTVALVVLACLNRENVAEKKEMQENGTFIITANGEQTIITMDDIIALEPRVIDANYKKSGKEPVQKQYTGVALKSIFDYFNIDYSEAKSVSFTAADGYASALTIGEALNEENCFIVIEEEGEPLGTKENGGKGPYMMILANDQFSQRWCKFLLEIELRG